ncbi:hypothetical protein SUGI_0102140 [Cryptomeria japonica]|nr:hypothetical protein SUGI_0102140 [Cryptomeria japonica]
MEVLGVRRLAVGHRHDQILVGDFFVDIIGWTSLRLETSCKSLGRRKTLLLYQIVIEITLHGPGVES